MQIWCKPRSTGMVEPSRSWTPTLLGYVDQWPRATGEGYKLQAIIDKALDWERRSGATVEAEKMAIIHFTRYTGRIDLEFFTIKGKMVVPRDQIKVLGVIMDLRLHCKQNIAKAIELKRLTGVAPCTTRQPFTAIVAPVVDYAANV
ncbi:hypothetical protein FOQG_18175 [Fusarium oxysporum f. sp. raphani 54005]|uniref:Reverse transcriptase domain-containing protein n=1 Tax=Fusarium oxysporum f. sp. raphani 54005 TaxID=1089458 RepID=X0BF59_FUSOX|nr:hypothetical protein FOQG_18175 [Fusarium oxysporum f. sp. raphani 54005]